MKYLILLAALTLSACSSLPTALQTCNTVVQDAALATNVLVTTTTAATTNGVVSSQQASKVAGYAAEANAIILTAQALCAAGSAAEAKATVAPAVASVKIMKACISTAKGAALDSCVAAAPKPKA